MCFAQNGPMADPQVTALEVLLQQLARLNQDLMLADSHERWGGGDHDEQKRYRDLGLTSEKAKAEVVAKLTAEVSRLRVENVEVLRAWVAAQVALREEARAALLKDEQQKGLVAEVTREIAAWQAVLTGPTAFVEPWSSAFVEAKRRVELLGV